MKKRNEAPATYESLRLPSGLRLVVGHVKERSSVAIGVWARVGGRY